MAKRRKHHKWEKRTLKMRDDATWKAPDGYAIFVADKGAVRFNVPKSWVVKPKDNRIELYDREPPDDDTRLSLTVFRTPPVDWSELPLSRLLADVTKDSDERGPIRTHPRPDVEIVWTEMPFDDPVEHRPACSRVVLARGQNIHALLTLDFWVDDTQRLEPMWQELLRSVELGRYVSDPTRGDVLH